MRTTEEWIIFIVLLLIGLGIDQFFDYENRAGIRDTLEQRGAKNFHISRIWFTWRSWFTFNRRRYRAYQVEFQDRRGKIYVRTCRVGGWDLWASDIEWDEE